MKHVKFWDFNTHKKKKTLQECTFKVMQLLSAGVSWGWCCKNFSLNFTGFKSRKSSWTLHVPVLFLLMLNSSRQNWNFCTFSSSFSLLQLTLEWQAWQLKSSNLINLTRAAFLGPIPSGHCKQVEAEQRPLLFSKLYRLHPVSAHDATRIYCFSVWTAPFLMTSCERSQVNCSIRSVSEQ